MLSRGRRSVDTDLFKAAVIEDTSCTTATPTAPGWAPIFDGEGNVGIFVQQFKDVAEENGGKERRRLL